MQDFENGSAAGKQHAKHEVPGDDLDTAKPQHDLPTASVNSANDAHSALKIKTEGKDGASSDDADQAKSQLAPNLAIPFILRMAPTIRLQTFLTYSSWAMEVGKHMEMVSMLPHTRGRCQSRMLMRLILQRRSTITQGTPITMRLTI